MIAALFVDPRGWYSKLPDVDLWPEERDARTYPGPHAVVAHPPCGAWGRYAGAKGGALGHDGGCFGEALLAVRMWGGVLEHPAASKAWPRFDLPRPSAVGWTRERLPFGRDGWSCLVYQGHYGHLADKATYLYFVGRQPPDLIWGPSSVPRRPYHPDGRAHGPGFSRARGNLERLSKRQRMLTPLPFVELLVSLARSVPGDEP